MKLEKASVKLLFTLALSFSLVPVVSAQVSPAAKSSRKPKTKAAAAAPATAPRSAEAGAPAAAEKPPSAGPRRDPFTPLVTDQKQAGSGGHLPPGKAGLEIGVARVDGTVRSPEGMIAVLSNPDQHVYFVKEGDQLYDGDVEKIELDGVTFRQNSKDAFGKRVERVVTKRIYASAGEQQ